MQVAEENIWVYKDKTQEWRKLYKKEFQSLPSSPGILGFFMCLKKYVIGLFYDIAVLCTYIKSEKENTKIARVTNLWHTWI